LKKLALVFVLAILAPALLLGVLALRTASRQQLIMERQEVELRQKETGELAAQVRGLLGDEQRSFLEAVDRLRARLGPKELALDFSGRLPAEWGHACIGFAVDENGDIISPSAQARTDMETKDFLSQNSAFLGNQAPAEVYEPALKAETAAAPADALQQRRSAAALDSAMGGAPAGSTADVKAQVSAAKSAQAYRNLIPQDADQSQQAPNTEKLRTVIPQYQTAAPQAPPLSQLNFSTSRFRQLVAGGHDGVLARYVEDELEVIFWVRPAGMDGSILGAQMKAADLFRAIRPEIDPFSSHGACLAILDDHALPVALSVPKFKAVWKNPFVATELGETLPHWEAALYLLNPNAVSESAQWIALTLYGLIGLAIGAIAVGSLLIAVDTHRQLRLAQKKTDFVSNVSHELKTPLTSIRMFAELLQERRVSDPAKTADYLRIIRLEAERLTRLINNVLDFARLERNQKHYTRRIVDLQPEIERLWEAQAEHLRTQGFLTTAEIAPGPWWADADSDAIVQVIVNLLSNAEKYSPEKKEIDFHADIGESLIRIAIADRGAGVPAGEEKKIFESFYRAHDSLSSGIPGSGLGLTLARRIARDHGGDIRCERRPGGGSIFTLTLPTHPIA
jgi:signal transduction histidine kinase